MSPEQVAYVLIGICGAIFANSTGAGGGVVFIPLFHALGLSGLAAVATSFGIQCFGMTTGAAAWVQHFIRHRSHLRWEAFVRCVALCAPSSIAGLWTAYGLDMRAPAETLAVFAVFSVVLGTAILWVAFTQRERLRSTLLRVDALALMLIAYVGGVVTAWISVGVGEFVAFYLIMRRYDVTESVAIAVVISAFTVWSAAPVHMANDSSAVWPLVFYAGPGAVIGALIARSLALRLGAVHLKRFFGFWLLVVGLSELM